MKSAGYFRLYILGALYVLCRAGADHPRTLPTRGLTAGKGPYVVVLKCKTAMHREAKWAHANKRAHKGEGAHRGEHSAWWR